MKRIVLSMVVAFGLASVSMAAITPITSFTPGHYLGTGSWLADDGTNGTFESFIGLEASGWVVVKLMFGNLYVYENTLTIDGNGFYAASLIDVSDPTNPAYYSGFGNCGTAQCQTTVYLNNGILQKSMVFNADGSVSCNGAIYFNDGTPNVQWEGSNALLP